MIASSFPSSHPLNLLKHFKGLLYLFAAEPRRAANYDTVITMMDGEPVPNIRYAACVKNPALQDSILH